MIGKNKVTIDQFAFTEFIKEEEIRKRVHELAALLHEEYAEKRPIFVGVLKGAFIFLADLVRVAGIPCEVQFVQLKSYTGMNSDQKLEIRLPILFDVEDRDIIVVEDIIDSGFTLNKFIELLKARKPNSIKLVTLLSKPQAIKFPIDIGFSCFEIPNDFVIGYGLDYDGVGRELRSIYKLKTQS